MTDAIAKPTCKTCPFYRPVPDRTDEGYDAFCIRHPRTPVWLSERDPGFLSSLRFVWSQTNEDSVCGEHPGWAEHVEATRRQESTPSPGDAPLKLQVIATSLRGTTVFNARLAIPDCESTEEYPAGSGGMSAREAIGSLVQDHPERFGVEIVYR